MSLLAIVDTLIAAVRGNGGDLLIAAALGNGGGLIALVHERGTTENLHHMAGDQMEGGTILEDRIPEIGGAHVADQGTGGDLIPAQERDDRIHHTEGFTCLLFRLDSIFIILGMELRLFTGNLAVTIRTINTDLIVLYLRLLLLFYLTLFLRV